MIINTEIIKNFEKLQESLPVIIRQKGTIKKKLYEYIGMTKNTFEKKLTNKNFTIPELKKIAKYYNEL